MWLRGGYGERFSIIWREDWECRMDIVRNDVMQSVTETWEYLCVMPRVRTECEGRIWMTIEENLGLRYSNHIDSVLIWGEEFRDESGF